ncbi:hypothetical protein HRbin09_01856 [bacterium HR09]|nr:hypothetical protein HRbin09_01856 [bacterium HR09]
MRGPQVLLRGARIVLAVLLWGVGVATANPQSKGATAATPYPPCSLLTKQEVLEALKATEAQGPDQPTTIEVEKVEEDLYPTGERVCHYSYNLVWGKEDKWNHLVRISYQRDPQALEELKRVKSSMGKPASAVERLSDLGEEAYWVEAIRLYVWVKGGLLKIDNGVRANRKELSILLAKRALGRIR